MSRITESAKTEKPADKVFEFLSNIKEMPKWSYVIKGIETNPDGTFKGETSYGPFNFKWDVDQANKKCTMTANIMGQDYSSSYAIKEESGKTVVQVDYPLNPGATKDQVLSIIQFELNKLFSLVK